MSSNLAHRHLLMPIPPFLETQTSVDCSTITCFAYLVSASCLSEIWDPHWQRMLSITHLVVVTGHKLSSPGWPKTLWLAISIAIVNVHQVRCYPQTCRKNITTHNPTSVVDHSKSKAYKQSIQVLNLGCGKCFEFNIRK